MNLNQLDICLEINPEALKGAASSTDTVTLEFEVPESLYMGMKDFINTNPNWDKLNVMSSALANFLYQNGSNDRAVIEKYLNDLFVLSDS